MFFKKKPKEKKYNFPYIEGADEYLWNAALILIEKQQGFVSILQQNLKIEFNRALNIMEQLYQLGIVGEMKSNTISRDVLVDKNGLIEIAEKAKIQKPKIYSQQDYQFFSQKTERINMYHNQYDYMTGEDFEIFVSQILRRIDFTNIQLTKGSGDQGVDIIAERDNIKYAIQCKRYSQPVGNKAVQEVFAGKFFYHCHVGVVVTNNYFTKSAKELAQGNGVVLWDRDFLNKHIGIIENSEKNDPDSILEKIYKINGEFTVFKLKKDNTVEILVICKSQINAANLYCSLNVKYKEEWLGKFNFVIVINLGNALAIYTNKEGIEFFGGKSENGEIEIGVPVWMDKARDEFLSENEEEILRMVEEANTYLDKFMIEAINILNN